MQPAATGMWKKNASTCAVACFARIQVSVFRVWRNILPAQDGIAALERPVSHYMTTDVIYAQPTETVATLMERMTDRRIRHLPVLSGDGLTGIVSIGDVVKCQIAEATQEAESLRTYIAAG